MTPVNPIIINLLVEEEQAARARGRDPVKLLIVISTGLLAVVLAIGGAMSGLARRSGAALNNLEQQWQELAKLQTSGSVGSYRVLNQWTGDLLAINQSRRLCAPQLALIKDLVPDFIQLTRLSLVTTAVTRTPTTLPAEDAVVGKAKITQGMPLAEQLLTLQLEGKVVSVHPEEDVAIFRQNLETNATFGAQIQQVQLRSYGRISGPTERGGSVVGQFVIECQYKEHP